VQLAALWTRWRVYFAPAFFLLPFAIRRDTITVKDLEKKLREPRLNSGYTQTCG